MPRSSRAAAVDPAGRGHGGDVLPALQVSEPEAQEAPRRRYQPATQAILINELRASIDIYLLRPRPDALARVTQLVTDNKQAVHAKHVLHGLGKYRIAWLREQRMIGFTQQEHEWLRHQKLA